MNLDLLKDTKNDDAEKHREYIKNIMQYSNEKEFTKKEAKKIAEYFRFSCPSYWAIMVFAGIGKVENAEHNLVKLQGVKFDDGVWQSDWLVEVCNEASMYWQHIKSKSLDDDLDTLKKLQGE